MNLEQEIKQVKPFNSPYQRAGVNILYTHNWLVSKMNVHFEGFKVTRKQYNILRILKGAGKPVSTAYIRERMLDKNSDVSRIVDRMFERGIINKAVCPSDKRLVDVELTESGLKLLEEINKEIEGMDEIFHNLDLEEIELLNTLLDKIRS
ncbi:MAG: MarR family transcriptional regulator [Saprospiraceae bacterium]|nr:MarR family transcriptional regulator [Saprospiraceae bacterium]